MIDMHVHTNFSEDSKVLLEDYCAFALKKGVKYICFTDHVDFNPADAGLNYYKVDDFFESFYKVKKQYKDALNLLAGIEFGEPHLYMKEFEHYCTYPYDYIMGSIHYFYNNMFLSQMVKDNIDYKLAFKKYFEQLLLMVEYGNIDCVAHFDFPKRYYKKLYYEEETVRKICATMLKRDICLEINTSSIRKGMDQPMPGEELLSIYKESGGEYITIGADTHELSHLAADFDIAKDLANKFKLKNVIFIERKRVEVKI